MQDYPKVTIITITFNGASEIEQTLQSVFHQNYPDLEYIVIDGASTDGTVELLKKYEQQITHWVSEPDKGIYDAMNKGVNMATGDWICFMNGGDWFKSQNVISEVFSQLLPNADLVYGDHEVVFEHGVKVKKAKVAHELWKGMVCSHQSLFCKRELLNAFPFDLPQPIIADFNFIFNCWLDGKTFQKVDTTIACFQSGGVSETKSIEAKQATFDLVLSKQQQVLQLHPDLNETQIKAFHQKLIAKEKWVFRLKAFLPNFLFQQLMFLKNKLK